MGSRRSVKECRHGLDDDCRLKSRVSVYHYDTRHGYDGYIYFCERHHAQGHFRRFYGEGNPLAEPADKGGK